MGLGHEEIEPPRVGSYDANGLPGILELRVTDRHAEVSQELGDVVKRCTS